VGASAAAATVMTEASLYDPELAALAIKQAAGDMVEAIFLLRAYRTTLPRPGYTCALDTSRMQLRRRISAAFKDLPGGHILGPTYDYTQRMLDFSLAAHGRARARAAETKLTAAMPDGAVRRVADLLGTEGLVEAATPDPGDPEPADLTRQPLEFPASRAERLQNLARGDALRGQRALGLGGRRRRHRHHPVGENIRGFYYAETCAVMIIVIVTVTAIDLVSARVRRVFI
jgi:alpha-D-ribose 1-methylphosphonate 5-triphosphate synthase subunit PhnI